MNYLGKARPIFWLLALACCFSVVMAPSLGTLISRPGPGLFVASPQEVMPRAVAALQFPLSPNFSASIASPVYGTVAVAGTTTATLVTATAGQRIYITGMWCFGTAATDTAVAVNDAAINLAYIPCPEGKLGASPVMTPNPPLRWSVNSPVTAAFSASVTTGYITVQGYKAFN